MKWILRTELSFLLLAWVAYGSDNVEVEDRRRFGNANAEDERFGDAEVEGNDDVEEEGKRIFDGVGDRKQFRDAKVKSRSLFDDVEKRIFGDAKTKDRLFNDVEERKFDELEGRIFDDMEERRLGEAKVKDRLLNDAEERRTGEAKAINKEFDDVEEETFGETKDRVFDEVEDTKFDKVEDRRFDEVEDRVFDKVEDRRLDEVEDKVFDEVEDRKFDKVEDRRFNEVEDRVFDEVKDRKFDEVEDTKFDKVEDRRFDEVEDRKFDEVEDTKFDKVEDRRFNEVEDKVFGEVEDRKFDEAEDRKFDKVEGRKFNKVEDRKFDEMEDRKFDDVEGNNRSQFLYKKGFGFRRRGGNQTNKTRIYYIAAMEIEWDFAPNGNLLGERASFAGIFLNKSRNPLRLGKVYKKAVFREFTDNTFNVLKEREAWQGILGPTIRGEVGYKIIVHFLNKATRSLSMHPHGTRYRKGHEGALYEDSATEDDKFGARVPPGARHTYNWFFIPEDGPTPTDPDCLTWMYHSHTNADTDIHAGLFGPLIVCRPGTLDSNGNPRNVDRSFVLFFLIFDENDSLFIDENIFRSAPGMTEEERRQILRNQGFRDSNHMFSVNGLGFGNLKGLETCLGEKVAWHIVGMGNQVDIHTISFESQVFTVLGRTTDLIIAYPAHFTTGIMIASRRGSFPFRCEVEPHGNAGMESNFTVNVCPNSREVKPKLNGQILEYFIAAEEIDWNYAPSGINRFNGLSLTEDENAAPYFIRNATRIGPEYKKAVFREYTDNRFKTKKPRGLQNAHLALLGPTLRAEVGDVIQIVFMNKATRPYNLQTNGAYYEHDKSSIPPGNRRTYSWAITEQYGPTSVDPDCLTWRYYSNVDTGRDLWDGLSGTLLTCRPGALDYKGNQKNVDKEFSLMFAIMDESLSHFIQDNIIEYTSQPNRVNIEDSGFIESNRMHAINGRMYGNLEGLDMCVGDKVSWHIFGFGRTIDLHTAYFHGQTFQETGRFKDTLGIAPSDHFTVIMNADNPGNWPLDCLTNEHFSGGMRAIFRVQECDRGRESALRNFHRDPKKIREYFIAAEEVEWDYAPINKHIITGQDLLQNVDSRRYVENGPDRIGSKYKKAVYREYTDGTFRERKRRTAAKEHLAILGPFIRAEVGEVIRVVFKNMATRNYNIHPHGVLLERSPEQTQKDFIEEDEEPVSPGETKIYEWPVPERAGPGRAGFNCTAWAYYSAVDVVKDTNTGLIGPLITCRPGMLSSKGYRKDMEHEFAVLFTIFDENQSWYLTDNIRKYTTRPKTVDVNDPEFRESNRMHAMNGRLYGSLRGLVAGRNTRTAWYLIGMGSQVDIHTAHFHGQTFLRRTDNTKRADVIDLIPGVFETFEMRMDNPGTWLFHCHVDDHMRAGMAATFTVQD